MRVGIILIMLFFGLANAGEGGNPPSPDSSKKPTTVVERKKFQDKDKDGFNDLRGKGDFEKLLKDAIREKKGKK